MFICGGEGEGCGGVFCRCRGGVAMRGLSGVGCGGCGTASRERGCVGVWVVRGVWRVCGERYCEERDDVVFVL